MIASSSIINIQYVRQVGLGGYGLSKFKYQTYYLGAYKELTKRKTKYK